MIAHIDFETQSAADLKSCGTDVYAQDPTTTVMCLAYCFDDEPIQMWLPDDRPPERLLDHIFSGGTVVGHNIGGFEMLIWNNVCALQYGWQPLSIDQCVDTMAMAYAMSLPGSLDEASKAAGINYQKDLKGHRIMLKLSQPRDVKPNGDIVWWRKEDVPEDYEKLYQYCIQDVVVERELHKRLMHLSKEENEIYRLDYKINRRGVYVDIPAAKTALKIVDLEKARLNEEMRKVTDNSVLSATTVGQLSDWLKRQNIEVPSVAKADVIALLERDDLPPKAREALLIRQEAGKTSTAKISKMIAVSSAGNRVRGLFQYHGASTGRWAGRRVQLQNLPRPKIKQEKVDYIFDILNDHRTLPKYKANIIRTDVGPVMSALSDCVRGFLRAKPGYDFIAGDFSAIEARVVAWLAGQESVLEIFRTHGKIYEHAASGIYHIPMSEVTKDQRQIGKVAILALGFGGGKGAFQAMAKGYGVKVTDKEADVIKNNWRELNPKIKQYWYDLEKGAIKAVLSSGPVKVGPAAREVIFKKAGSFLWCRLPSGRALCYPYPKIVQVDTPWGEVKDALTYMVVDTYTNKWQYPEKPSWGGVLCENVTQAIARDLLSNAMLRLEKKKYPIVMHVHDEVVCEVKKDRGSLKEVENIMAEAPPWAMGLPIGAEGWRAERFRK